MLACLIPKRNLSSVARAVAVALFAFLLGGGSHHAGAGAAPRPQSAAGQASAAASDPLGQALAEYRRNLPRSSRSAAPLRSRASAGLRDAPRTAPARPSKVRPVPGAITGVFGEIRGGGRAHAGVDLDGEVGDPVVSAAAGLIVHSGPPPPGMSGYGNLVVVNHPDGTHALYAHLSAVALPAGTTVEPGTLIGAIGVSGFVTGSHLHWEIRIGDTTIDPWAWLHS